MYTVKQTINAELHEIDENLMRMDLKPAQRAALTLRRSELIKKISQKEQEEANIITSRKKTKIKRGRGRPFVHASVRDIARKTGRSRAAVHADKKRAKIIGVDKLDKISGTGLDKGTELDALVNLPEQKRD